MGFMNILIKQEGVTIMALEDKLNQAKGALKENAGKLTDNKELQAEGAVEYSCKS